MSLRARCLLALLAAFAGACSEQPPEQRPAVVCGPIPDEPLSPPSSPPARRVLAVVSDYQSGSVRFVDPETATWRPESLPATGDTVARTFGSTLALLDRGGSLGSDSLTLYDLSGAAPRFLGQLGLLTAEEAGRDPRRQPPANAHDLLAVSPRKAYVARWNLPSLAVVDLASRCVASTLDLSAPSLRGRAELPHPDALALVDGRVWVTLERLDDVSAPTQRGAIAVIDPRTDRVTEVIELPYANPTGPILEAPGSDGARRWVVTLGDYHRDDDGGVVELDVATRRVLRVVVREQDVGANIDGLALLGPDRVLLKVSAARVGDGELTGNALVELSLTESPPRVTPWLRTDTWSPATPVVTPEGRVFVGDPGDPSARRPGSLRVFTTRGEARETLPLGSGAGMRPYDLRLTP